MDRSENSGAGGALTAGLQRAGVRWPLLTATHHRAHDDHDPEPQDDQIGDHLHGEHEPRVPGPVLSIMGEG